MGASAEAGGGKGLGSVMIGSRMGRVLAIAGGACAAGSGAGAGTESRSSSARCFSCLVCLLPVLVLPPDLLVVPFLVMISTVVVCVGGRGEVIAL